MRYRTWTAIASILLTAGAVQAAECLTPESASGTRFLWPAPESVDEAWERLSAARPVIVVQADVISIRRPGIGDWVGPNPSWDNIAALVPETESISARQAAEAKRITHEISDAGGELFENGRWDQVWARVDHHAYVAEDAVVAFWGQGGRVEVVDDSGASDARRALDGAPIAELSRACPGRPVVIVTTDRVDAVRVDREGTGGPILPGAFRDWFYATSLLQLERPLYAPETDESGDWLVSEEVGHLFDAAAESSAPEGVAAAEALSTLADSGDSSLDRAATFAESEGRCDLALRLRSRYRPMGMCSMDTRPQSAARSYAELCHRLGDLPCFLNLQVRIMGDQFDRVAYSSYGEASHGTEAELLREAGIDVDRFLLGLLYSFDAAGPERIDVGWWRLARSIHEADASNRLGATLTALAENPKLDTFNRLQATAVLTFARFLEDGRKTPISEIQQEIGRLALDPFARIWLESLTKED